MEKKRFYPLRDADHPYHVTRIPITKEQYQGLMPEIYNHRTREQYHDRCYVPKKALWSCDGQCDMCRYHMDDGRFTSADLLSEQGFDPQDSAILPEDAVTNDMVYPQVLERLKQLLPEALDIGRLRMAGYTETEAAEILGIARVTYRYRVRRAKRILADEFPNVFDFFTR